MAKLPYNWTKVSSGDIISFIYENKEGLWVGCKLGLLRRDENGWKIIVEEEEENDWWFAGLGESEDGTLWILVEGESLFYRLLQLL